MADTQYTGKKITALQENTTAADNDLYVIGNAGSATMRKFTFANLANAVRDKLKTLQFNSGTNALTTTNKTLPGAINELNTKSQRTLINVAAGTSQSYNFQFTSILYTGHNSVAGLRGVYILSNGTVNPVIPATNYTVAVSGMTVTITNTGSAGTVVGVMI